MIRNFVGLVLEPAFAPALPEAFAFALGFDFDFGFDFMVALGVGINANPVALATQISLPRY